MLSYEKTKQLFSDNELSHVPIDHELYLGFNDTLQQLLDVLRISSAGIVLYQHGQIQIVAASDNLVSSIDPDNFYTLTTVAENRETEMMMPFGCQTRFAMQPTDLSSVLYYCGIPLRLKSGVCVGCIFVLNNKHAALSEFERKVLKQFHKALQLEISLHLSDNQYNDLRNYYEQILDAQADPIFMKNRQFEIIYANRAFMELYPENQRHKVIGYTTLEKYRQEEVDIFLQDDKDAFADGQKQVVEKISFPNGSVRTMHTTKTRMKIGKQEVILGISKDITDEQLVQQQLSSSQHDIEQLSRIAKQHLAQPLDTIQRTASYISEDYRNIVDETAQQQLLEIQEKSVVIGQFLNTMTDFAQIQRRPEFYQTFCLNQFVTDLQKLVVLPASDLLMSSSINVQLPKASCQMVLLALLQNTILHSHEARPRVLITADIEKYGTRIHYRDFGIGFKAKKLPFKESYGNFHHEDTTPIKHTGLMRCMRILSLYDATLELMPSKSGAHLAVFWPNR